MTAQQAKDIVKSIVKQAEKSAAEEGKIGDHKTAFVLGFIKSAFEHELKKMVYESSNDN